MVYSFITPTRGELLMDYVMSFVPLDDVSDESIDHLTHDLKRVTHLTVAIGPLMEHVFEVETIVGGTNANEDMIGQVHTSLPNWQTGTPSTDLPRHPQSELVYLINDLHRKFDIFSIVCDKVDKMEDVKGGGET